MNCRFTKKLSRRAIMLSALLGFGLVAAQAATITLKCYPEGVGNKVWIQTSSSTPTSADVFNEATATATSSESSVFLFGINTAASNAYLVGFAKSEEDAKNGVYIGQTVLANKEYSGTRYYWGRSNAAVPVTEDATYYACYSRIIIYEQVRYLDTPVETPSATESLNGTFRDCPVVAGAVLGICGEYSFSPSNVATTGQVTVTVKPRPGYEVVEWALGTEVIQEGGNTCTLDATTARQILRVRFKPHLTMKAGEWGTFVTGGVLYSSSGVRLNFDFTYGESSKYETYILKGGDKYMAPEVALATPSPKIMFDVDMGDDIKANLQERADWTMNNTKIAGGGMALLIHAKEDVDEDIKVGYAQANQALIRCNAFAVAWGATSPTDRNTYAYYRFVKDENNEYSYQLLADDDYLKAGEVYFRLLKSAQTSEIKDKYVIQAGVPTAIKSVPTATETDAPVYNLAGQRVSNDYKGIVIQNGKKMIRK